MEEVKREEKRKGRWYKGRRMGVKGGERGRERDNKRGWTRGIERMGIKKRVT